MVTKKQIRHEDMLDNRLFEVLEVANMPEKFGVTKDNEIITLYPVPIFKGIRVIRVEYQTNKSFVLPEALLERICILEDEIEAVNKEMEKKAPKNPAPKGRPSKFIPEDAVKMLELKEQGLSYKEIAEMFGTTAITVSNYMRKHNKNKKGETGIKEAERNGRHTKQMKAESLMHIWAEEYKAGASSRQIADKYALSDQTVRNYLKKLEVM